MAIEQDPRNAKPTLNSVASLSLPLTIGHCESPKVSREVTLRSSAATALVESASIAQQVSNIRKLAEKYAASVDATLSPRNSSVAWEGAFSPN